MRFGTFSYNQSRPAVPEKQAFEELLEQILLTERLGFDEAWFAEHHHSDYGMLASPNLIIASLAPRTERLRMGNLVSVLPLYDPMRFAEECSMLDILTNGRLNVGVGRGVPKDDIKHRLDRETAQARFEEGIDILRRSWTGETFSYSGKAWSYEEISCRPQPLQKPHPPIYYGAARPKARPWWRAAAGTLRCRASRWRIARGRSNPIARSAPSMPTCRAPATPLWCATFMSPIPTSRRGSEAPPQLPASGNWPPIMSGAAILFPPTICLSSPTLPVLIPAA